ncbi:hypothetical protein V2J09_012617 [Rumex salicifolius]
MHDKCANRDTFDHLRVLGYLCYPTLTATTNHKLEPRTRPCLFLGYATGHKGYRCLELVNRKVIISRHFLGIPVKSQAKGIHLSQAQYALEILERVGMTSCNPCKTPVDTSPKLSSNASEPVADPTEYRSVAGSLQYLCFTRPDICYLVQECCLYLHDPRTEHLVALKRILRYIKGTTHLGLTIIVKLREI